MNNKLPLYLLALSLFVFSCKKQSLTREINTDVNTSYFNSGERIADLFPETFESGTKTTYTTANVSLGSGSWNFNNSMIGTSSSDRKTGSKAARIQSTGKLSMNFDVQGTTKVSISHAKYGSDASSTWQLLSSVNSGSSWTQVGSTITTSSTTLNTAVFVVAFTGNVRFQIKKLSGGKLNIDNILIEQADFTSTRDNNMALGNPSAAVTDISIPNNYLLEKPQYVLSYNNSKGEPNWVSWHLSAAWKGNAPRCDCFNQDNQLPNTFFRPSTSNYTNSGFDRGHMCPSEDRDGSDVDNAATFLMSNIIPQAPVNNQQTWNQMETYIRTLIYSGYECYVISGGYGSGGTGSLGGVSYTINNGNINVPSHVWKIVVVIPVGDNDVTRIATDTRVIAVSVPNNQTVNSMPWYNYRTSVDNIEAATGYDFLSSVDAIIQSSIEAQVDSTPIL